MTSTTSTTTKANWAGLAVIGLLAVVAVLTSSATMIGLAAAIEAAGVLLGRRRTRGSG